MFWYSCQYNKHITVLLSSYFRKIKNKTFHWTKEANTLICKMLSKHKQLYNTSSGMEKSWLKINIVREMSIYLYSQM